MMLKIINLSHFIKQVSDSMNKLRTKASMNMSCSLVYWGGGGGGASMSMSCSSYHSYSLPGQFPKPVEQGPILQ